MIPASVRQAIKDRFPDAKLYEHDSPVMQGFAVELHGLRNGWMLDGSDWATVTDKALAWLADVERGEK